MSCLIVTLLSGGMCDSLKVKSKYVSLQKQMTVLHSSKDNLEGNWTDIKERDLIRDLTIMHDKQSVVSCKLNKAISAKNYVIFSSFKGCRGVLLGKYVKDTYLPQQVLTLYYVPYGYCEFVTAEQSGCSTSLNANGITYIHLINWRRRV